MNDEITKCGGCSRKGNLLNFSIPLQLSEEDSAHRLRLNYRVPRPLLPRHDAFVDGGDVADTSSIVTEGHMGPPAHRGFPEDIEATCDSLDENYLAASIFGMNTEAPTLKR